MSHPKNEEPPLGKKAAGVKADFLEVLWPTQISERYVSPTSPKKSLSCRQEKPGAFFSAVINNPPHSCNPPENTTGFVKSEGSPYTSENPHRNPSAGDETSNAVREFND